VTVCSRDPTPGASDSDRSGRIAWRGRVERRPKILEKVRTADHIGIHVNPHVAAGKRIAGVEGSGLGRPRQVQDAKPAANPARNHRVPGRNFRRVILATVQDDDDFHSAGEPDERLS